MNELYLVDNNDGGWGAESTGAKLPTLVVDHALLGVRVPAGERTVVCEDLEDLEAVVAHAKVAGGINWAQWQEERF